MGTPKTPMSQRIVGLASHSVQKQVMLQISLDISFQNRLDCYRRCLILGSTFQMSHSMKFRSLWSVIESRMCLVFELLESQVMSMLQSHFRAEQRNCV